MFRIKLNIIIYCILLCGFIFLGAWEGESQQKDAKESIEDIAVKEQMANLSNLKASMPIEQEADDLAEPIQENPDEEIGESEEYIEADSSLSPEGDKNTLRKQKISQRRQFIELKKEERRQLEEAKRKAEEEARIMAAKRGQNVHLEKESQLKIKEVFKKEKKKEPKEEKPKEITGEKENAVKAKKIAQEGIKLFNKKDNESARNKFEEALAIDPKNKSAKDYLKKIESKKAKDEKKIASQLKKEADLEKRKFNKRKKKLENNAAGAFGLDENGVQELLNDIYVKDIPELQNLTLEDCIKIGLQNNLQLAIADRQIKLAKQKISQAMRNLGPSLKGKWEQQDGKVSGRYYTGHKLLMEFNQPVFHGGELVYTLGQENVNLKIVENDYNKIKAGLILGVEKAYYGMDKSKKSVETQKKVYDRTAVLNEITKKEYELGAVNKIEYLNVTAKYSQANFQYVSSKDDLETAKMILQQAMNIEDDIDIAVVAEPSVRTDIEINDCYRMAMENRPEMKINFYMVEYYIYEKKIKTALGSPKADFLGSWGYSQEDFIPRDNPEGHMSNKFAPEWYVGVKSSLPFGGNTMNYTFTKETWQPVVNAFQGTESSTHTITLALLDNLKYFSDLTEADIGFFKAQQEFNKGKQDIIIEVKETYSKYKKAIMNLEVAKARLEYQKQQVEFMELKRELNEAPASTVMEELVKLAEEEYGILQAIADYYIAIKSLNKVVGVPGYFG